MTYPPDHPMRPSSPPMDCPHCGETFLQEDGPICPYCEADLKRKANNHNPFSNFVNESDKKSMTDPDYIATRRAIQRRRNNDREKAVAMKDGHIHEVSI